MRCARSGFAGSWRPGHGAVDGPGGSVAGATVAEEAGAAAVDGVVAGVAGLDARPAAALRLHQPCRGRGAEPENMGSYRMMNSQDTNLETLQH